MADGRKASNDQEQPHGSVEDRAPDNVSQTEGNHPVSHVRDAPILAPDNEAFVAPVGQAPVDGGGDAVFVGADRLGGLGELGDPEGVKAGETDSFRRSV